MSISNVKFELKIELIDFKYLYKIVKIVNDKITFKKYKANRYFSENEGMEYVSLEDDLGDETYSVTPDINLYLVGRVGDLIKSYEGILKNKKNKILFINKINEIYGGGV